MRVLRKWVIWINIYKLRLNQRPPLLRKYLEDHPELAEEFETRLRRAEALVAFYESQAGTSPEDAARIIIEGIKKKQWRILIGQDAVGLDGLQRSNPEGYQEVLLTILPKEFLES